MPTHAGKTRACRVCANLNEAHPRSRGENLYMPRVNFSTPGSSPLTRGKLRVARTGQVVDGLIPAHAGKTRMRADGGRALMAHPRSRGENLGGVF